MSYCSLSGVISQSDSWGENAVRGTWTLPPYKSISLHINAFQQHHFVFAECKSALVILPQFLKYLQLYFNLDITKKRATALFEKYPPPGIFQICRSYDFSESKIVSLRFAGVTYYLKCGFKRIIHSDDHCGASAMHYSFLRHICGAGIQNNWYLRHKKRMEMRNSVKLTLHTSRNDGLNKWWIMKHS